MKPKDVLEMIKAQDVKIVDFKFMDFPGQWQHFSVPVDQLKDCLLYTSPSPRD